MSDQIIYTAYSLEYSQGIYVTKAGTITFPIAFSNRPVMGMTQIGNGHDFYYFANDLKSTSVNVTMYNNAWDVSLIVAGV